MIINKIFEAIQRFFAFLILIIISPIYLVIVLVIFFVDGRPIHFVQKRPGQNHKLFNFYKFRTMKLTTPNVATHLLKNPNDFIIPFGNILRRLSLDELPNLINIIKGELNFIGPRPALYNQYDLIKLREKFRIDKLKPGLTGWAQVNGRDELNIIEKVNLELYYLENKNLLLDFKILLMTLKNTISGKNIIH